MQKHAQNLCAKLNKIYLKMPQHLAFCFSFISSVDDRKMVSVLMERMGEEGTEGRTSFVTLKLKKNWI